MGGELAARKLVGEHELDVSGHAQLQQIEVSLGKMAARQFVHQYGGFEGRAGETVLDAPHGVTEVEQARRLLALLEQAQQAPPQQRGLGQVGVAFARPKQEDGGTVGNLRNSLVEAGKILGNLDCRHHLNYCRAERARLSSHYHGIMKTRLALSIVFLCLAGTRSEERRWRRPRAA